MLGQSKNKIVKLLIFLRGNKSTTCLENEIDASLMIRAGVEDEARCLENIHSKVILSFSSIF